MSKICAVGSAVPEFKHDQQDIFEFMHRVYAMNEAEKRKLRYLYRQGNIETRYSVIPDYSLAADKWQFYPATENLEPFPDLEQRMSWYKKHAAALSLQAAMNCVEKSPGKNITHLITVSCTGLSAPGLDLELLELLGLPRSTVRTSVNFMGCYAALHALKIADAFCKGDKTANVLIVCLELCTLHFQREKSLDNITSSMLFGDGAAAVLVTGDHSADGLKMKQFHSTVTPNSSGEMAWEISSSGFLMTLSNYIPDLIGGNFDLLLAEALNKSGLSKEDISHWCIHPGGKRILEVIQEKMNINETDLLHSWKVLKNYGNMSSATVLFVLESIMNAGEVKAGQHIMGAAFGPGLTMETFILES